MPWLSSRSDFRLNDTTDTTVSAAVTNTVLVSAFNGTGLSIAVTAGDYFEIKWVTPTWTTNPTSVAADPHTAGQPAKPLPTAYSESVP